MLFHNIIKQKGSYTLLASHNLGQGNNEVKSNKVDYQKNYYVRVAWVTPQSTIEWKCSNFIQPELEMVKLEW